MVLGTFVKIILIVQAIIGIIAGITVLVAPLAITQSTGLQIGGEIVFVGVFIIAFQGFILYGLTKLHE